MKITLALLIIALAALAVPSLQDPVPPATPPADDITGQEPQSPTVVRNKRWIGALFSLGRAAASIGSRVASGVASSAARAGLGAARLGSNAAR